MAKETRAEAVNNQLEADALVLTGAAIVGIKDGVQEVAENKAALARKIAEPGDQRHIAHPIDDLVTNSKNLISDISNKLEAAYSTGDMNIKHSQARQPHPIDTALQARDSAITATTDMLAQKGPVEGTRAFSAIAAGIAAENAISPSAKAKAMGSVTDIASELRTANGIKDALPINARDFEHLTLLPQLPSAERLNRMKELSDAGKDVEVVTMQMSSVPYGWAAFGGGSALAAGMVLNNRDKERADEIATLPLNEQKAIAYDEGHTNTEKKARALEKFPELQEAFQAYDEANVRANKLFPEPVNHNHSFEGQYGGQSEASGKRASYSFQASQAIYDAIKNGQPIPHEQKHEQHTKATQILENELASLPVNARSIVLDRIAENTSNHIEQQDMKLS